MGVLAGIGHGAFELPVCGAAWLQTSRTGVEGPLSTAPLISVTPRVYLCTLHTSEQQHFLALLFVLN